jgi:hypothetical protein
MGEQGLRYAWVAARGFGSAVVRGAAPALRGGAAMLVVLGAGLAACGSDDDDDSMPSAGSGGSAGAEHGDAGSKAGSGGTKAGDASDAGVQDKITNAELYGAFQLKLIAATAKTPAVSSVQAAFYDAEKFPMTILKLEDENGACRLNLPLKPYCENCAGKCTADDVCTPTPSNQDLGVIHLRAGSHELDLEAVAKNYQLSGADKLPYPPCPEGEAASIAVAGGSYEGFMIETRCIAPLEVGGPFTLEPGKPLALSWTAPGDPDLARIEIRLDISHHGGFAGEIDCDVPDNGAFEIPSALTDQLLDLGVAGFPTVQLTRTASAQAAGGEPSHVTMAVSMFVEREVTIPGLVSCASDSKQCPDGQTCQTDLTCK